MNPVVNEYSQSSWLISMSNHDSFDGVFRTDESIMEIMSWQEKPWDDNNHHSSFLLKWEVIENNFDSVFLPEIVAQDQSPLSIYEESYERNLGIIFATIPIDISVEPIIIENIHIWASCSME